MSDQNHPTHSSHPELIKHVPLFWFFVVLLGVFVFAVLMPTSYVPFSPSQDKINHIIIFTLLTVVSRLVFRLNKIAWLSALLGLAAISEGIQYFLPYRQGSWLDIRADIIGISVGCCIAAVYYLIKKRYKKTNDH